MRIVVLDGYTLNPGDLNWDVFSQWGEVTIYDRTSRDEIIERIGQAEIVLTNKTPLDRVSIDACAELRYIGLLSTGYDVVDVEHATEKGITVTNIPEYGTTTVAQYAAALLLELCHHVGDHSRSVHQGNWTSSKDFCYWEYDQIELYGKAMGIIGYGKIGRTFAQVAHSLGMKVIAFDRSGVKEDASVRSAELEELLRVSDFISLHCPLNEETYEMICEKTIMQMKNGVRLINTSRGGLLNETDVAQALRTGKIAAAAVDVVSKEPISSDNPLLSAPNCIITPHIAWAALEARTRLINTVADNLSAFLRKKPVNVVNNK